jgi:phenylpropionate dioxygenase-like ring-hydroxylating dioxygenase large terminal subunit
MLPDHWYIACPSQKLASRPRQARVLDAELVVFRDDAGVPRALLDRCCHRGAPLSSGKIVCNAVECPYHGWRYDGSGACVHIPSLIAGQKIPERCAVPAFECVEQDGYVWVWMGSRVPGPIDRPTVPHFDRHGWIQGSRERQCTSLRSLENSIDWCHPAFVHSGNHPQSQRVQERGFEESAYEMRLHDKGMLVFAPPTRSEREAVPDDARVIVRFDLPDRMIVRRPHLDMWVVMHFVPTSANTCRMEWLVHHPGVTKPGLTWSDEEGQIFAQDRLILEAAQRQYDRADVPFENSVESDAAPLMLRRVVELARLGRWNSMRPRLRKRRVVRIRA